VYKKTRACYVVAGRDRRFSWEFRTYPPPMNKMATMNDSEMGLPPSGVFDQNVTSALEIQTDVMEMDFQSEVDQDSETKETEANFDTISEKGKLCVWVSTFHCMDG